MDETLVQEPTEVDTTTTFIDVTDNNNETTKENAYGDKNVQDEIVKNVQETLVKTLKVCLTPTEAERIKKEFDKNIQVQQLLKDQMKTRVLNLNLPSVLKEIKTRDRIDAENLSRKRMNFLTQTKSMIDTSSDEDDRDLDTTTSSIASLKRKKTMESQSFVKPKFMRMECQGSQRSPYTSEKSRKLMAKLKGEKDDSEVVQDKFQVFEKSYTRTRNKEKVLRTLERQKRKAEYIDKDKKYLGFGETFDKEAERQKKKEEKRKKKEERRQEREIKVRTLKKANVTKEETALMNELMQYAEAESMNTDSSVTSTNLASDDTVPTYESFQANMLANSTVVNNVISSANSSMVNDVNNLEDFSFPVSSQPSDDFGVEDFDALLGI